MAGITGTNGNRQVGQDLYKDKYQRWMTGFPTEAGPGTGMPNPAGTHYLTKENIRGGYGDTVKDGMYVGHEDPWGGSELGTIVPEPPAPAGHDIAEDDLEYDSMREQPDVTESRQPVQKKASKTITTIDELKNDPDALRRFNKSSREGRIIALEKISKKFRNATEEAKSLVLKKLLSIPAPISEGTGGLDAPKEWKDVGLEAWSNLDTSAIEMGKNLWQAITNPIETAKGVGSLVSGAVKFAVPGGETGNEAFDHMVGFYKDRYGSIEGFKNAIAKDPVGVLSDLSVAIGGPASVAVKATQAGGLLNKILSTASKVQFADPAYSVGTGISKGVGKGVKSLTPDFSKRSTRNFTNKKVQNALNITNDLVDSDLMAKEILERGYLLTRNQSDKLAVSMRRIGKEIDREVDRATKAGEKIQTDKIVAGFDEVANNLAKSGIAGVNEPAFIKKLNELREAWRGIKGETMTPREVQNLKTALGKKYKDLAGEFGQLTDKLDDGLRNAAMHAMNEIFPPPSKPPKYTIKSKLTPTGKKGLKDIKGSVGREGIEAVNKEFGIQKELEKLIRKRANELLRKGGFLTGGLESGATAKLMSSLIAGGAGFATGGPIGGTIGFVGALALIDMFGQPNQQIRLARLLAKTRNMKISVAKKLVKSKMAQLTKEVAAEANRRGLQVATRQLSEQFVELSNKEQAEIDSQLGQ